MKCEICHINDAEQSIVKSENGLTKELYVCKSCASQHKIGHVGKYSLADVLFDMSSTKQPEEQEPPKIEQKCPSCGSTFAKIRKENRVGCPDCYNFFEDQLDRMVSIYSTSNADLVNNDVNELRQKLDAAIASERFEDAAVLRDLINSKEKVSRLSPFANKDINSSMPPGLLDAIKDLGLDIGSISKPSDDDLDFGFEDDPQDDDSN
ncbi:MAG: UvrB/UvrC motif-containing protein [Kiritimatiellae bacterium]|jgi:protein arginine kinase activator|nr:UvrB/UvrC motif-containing protein [Kiritimatiellia bacterium]